MLKKIQFFPPPPVNARGDFVFCGGAADKGEPPRRDINFCAAQPRNARLI